MPPASENDKEILRLFASGDDLAFARFCEEYFDAVYTAVKNFNLFIHDEDDTLISDVVTDTFLKFYNSPHRYNPEKSSLERFLVMDAEGDLKNAWEKHKRKSKKLLRGVELEAISGNSITEPVQTPLENILNKEYLRKLERKLEELFPSEADSAVAQLMLAGERRTEEYARLLRIDHLAPEEQRREVKRNKDRIDKVIQRKWRKDNEHG